MSLQPDVSPATHHHNLEGHASGSWRGLRTVACLLIAVISVSLAGFTPIHAQDADKDADQTDPASQSVDDKNDADKAADTDDADDKDPAKKNPRIPENPFPNRFKAPDLEGGAGWLNCAGEISMKDLKGKVVLLDFWTFCCINCMHILPDLKFLEQKYPKELVVVGVHSAKFENEKETENIRRAIVRYEIEHPVINDNEMTVWRKFGVRSWPTLVLIDPEGFYCGYISGEGQRELLDTVIEKLVAYHRAKGTLDETPVNFSLERSKLASGPLKFPGKVLADATGKRLFISDSNHNRIVVASLAGKLLSTIGTGAIGRDDGAIDKATFDHPQGMALDGETLYIADTENHSIRKVDLKEKLVTTLAGTGTQGHERFKGGPGLKIALNSPWDLHLQGNKLFIAMAGPHQLWTYDLEKETVQPYAGSGREDVTNGALRVPGGEGGVDLDPGDMPRISAFAQPSGLASDGKSLYVVDSEGSSIRRVPMSGEGKVTTVAGTSDLPGGQSLFAFGDKDGTGDAARFQHPLGIAYSAGKLYVADSYNHKIKVIDPKSGETETLYGDGKPGAGDKPLQFSEPAGLAIAGDTLYVADTNNHKIRKIDLTSGKSATLEIAGLTPPNPPKSAVKPDEVKATEVEPQTVDAAGDLELELNLELPEGYKLNPELTPTYRVKAVGESTLIAAEALNGKQEAEAVPDKNRVLLKLPLAKDATQGEIQVTVTLGYCRGGTGGLCKLKTLAWKIPVRVELGANQKLVTLSAKVE
ncbi:MAG: thioredoxin-like domain-containing protein [Planctomycetota bacterium]|nr:thioredoxin-like domain-containing protein [Planctomycetota bacterium]